MAEISYWRALIAISFSLYIKTTDSAISVTKIEYIGKRNVWHEGEQYHEVALYLLQFYTNMSNLNFRVPYNEISKYSCSI